MYRNVGIGSWIARCAQRSPDRIALIDEDRHWTYAELDVRITRLARALIAQGIGAGDRVAFLGGNHPAALETLFACGLVGAIAVMMHPGFDETALAQVLADGEPHALIVTPEYADTARGLRTAFAVQTEIVTGLPSTRGVLSYEALVADASAEPLDRAIELSDPCLIAFSSGTTGTHKGVVLSHSNMLFNTLNVLSCVDLHRDDVILSSAPLYRMGGLGFTLPVLFKGGTSVLQRHADATHSLELIERYGVTIVFDSPPSLDAISRCEAFGRTELSTLREVLTGGSHVPRALIETYLERGLAIRQGYGLTEAAPLALMSDRDEVATRSGAAGRPPLYGAVRVVDGDLEDVAPGILGELLYRGPNVMQKYWRAPEATARAIVADGWLRTGDAAVMDVDGTVSIAGRIADVLVCDGRRIDPGAIEADIVDHTGAHCALVQADPDAGIVAFTIDGGAPHDPGLIELACRAHLPAGWDVEVRSVDALPINANGKIVRRALRSRAVVEPATELTLRAAPVARLATRSGRSGRARSTPGAVGRARRAAAATQTRARKQRSRGSVR